MRLEDLDRETQARLVARLEAELGSAKALPFLRSVATAAPHVTAAYQFALGSPSSLISRFLRWGLPSPKTYLAGARLVRAHALLASSTQVTLDDVAVALRYSSGQAFARHVREQLGVHSTTWRLTVTTEAVLDQYVRLFVTPYAATLAWFDPYADAKTARLWSHHAKLERAS